MTNEARQAARIVIDSADGQEAQNMAEFIAIRKLYTFEAVMAAWCDTRDQVTLLYPEDLQRFAATFQGNSQAQIVNVLLIVEAAHGETLKGNCHTCGDRATHGDQCGECIGALVAAVIAHGTAAGWLPRRYECFDCGRTCDTQVCPQCVQERGTQC